ncbi:MAG: PAS domain S-box protein [Candidatus Heimdallarchaeota archaeon]|nr:PAS domain S-box protein [Candidatus Heimdallarchaeota archaeon]
MRRADSEIIAALAVQINPQHTLNRITRNSRIGKTGEVLVFDKNARLVTESRFENKLKKNGRLQQEQSSIHNVVLRVPNENKSEKKASSTLTYMARSATSRESGVNAFGYLDYRGIRVLGAWLWDDQLEIGISSEIDEDEALETYLNTRVIVIAMIIISLLLIFGLMYFIRLIKIQSSAELEKSEAYLRVVLQNAADGIITLGEMGEIQTFNNAAESLFGYKADEIIGSNIDYLILGRSKSKDETSNNIKGGYFSGLNLKQGLKGQRKDSSVFPIGLSVSEIKLEDKCIYVAIVRDMTVEYQTHEELEFLVNQRTNELLESEALNRQILDSAGEGIYGINTVGEAIFINPSAASMLGYEPDELIGDQMHARVHHSYPDGSQYDPKDCPIYETFTSGAVHKKSDEVLWCKNGSAIPVEYISKPIHSNSGEIIGAVVTFSDITERLEVEQNLKALNTRLEYHVEMRTAELKRSQNVLNRAQKIAHLGSWNWDITTDELSWSDEIYRIFGLAPNAFEATYNAFVDTIHPQDRDMVSAAVNTSLADPAVPYDIEHRIVLPDGEIRHVHELGEITRDSDNTPVYMIGIVHDVTELKKSQQESKQAIHNLAKNERVLRLALSSAGAGYFHFDVNKSALFWDPRSMEIYGVTESEFKGCLDDWSSRLHAEDRSKYSAEFLKALQDQTATSFRLGYRIQLTDGEVRHIQVAGYVERDLAGEASEVHGLHFDITESKQAEQKLIDALEIADLANRAKSEFLAVMSHEIRTPMNAIIGMSNLVMNTDLAPRQHSYLEKVVSSAESLLHVINDILDFSKIEAGQLQLECIDFRLDEVLDKLTHLVALKAQEKGLEFLFSISNKLPESLKGDPTRLLQVIVNLANNAVKFTESGEIILTIEVVAESEDKLEVKFEIRDTGIGIEEENKQYLFKSFSQADASVTRKYGGTGLGLAIVKKLVNLMGGNIGFDSKAGSGSCFYFTVPFGRSKQGSQTDTALLKNMHNLHVLVVDDSDSARLILKETLEGFGFTVTVAATCSEAISKLKTAEQRGNPYKLILMDWKMPEQSGVEGAKLILGQDKSHVTPVVMMVTAYNSEDLAAEIENIAVAATLVKPVSPSSLLDAILNAFKEEQIQSSTLSKNAYYDTDLVTGLSGKYVLVVDDNDLNMELVVELLREADVVTSSACNGEEAVKLLSEQSFDAVLMDIHMPVMDGLEATRIIRNTPELSSMPVIALTADSMDSEKEKILSAGVNDVIVKPIKVNLLLEILAKNLADIKTDSLLSFEENVPQEQTIDFNIPGVDIQAGLETCNGKINLYKRLLNKFTDEFDFIEKFKNSLKVNDFDSAERLVHTIKGSAGNIGAYGIQKSADALQSEIIKKSDNKKIMRLYAKLKRELVSVVKAIGKINLEPENNIKAENTNPTNLIPALDELSSLLADDDTDATEKIENISIELKNSQFENDINVIARHVSRYEFKIAFDRLNKLTEKIKAA